MTASPDQLVAYTVAAIGFLGAVFERLKSSKREAKTEQENTLLSDAKMFQERGDILKKLAEDNLKLYEKEHADHVKTREYWHDQAGRFQATLADCQAKLQEMKSRPDYSDILRFIEQQSQTGLEILKGIREILTEMKGKYSQGATA